MTPAILAEYLHIHRSQVMAFGDGLNDLSMIRDAGIDVAMGNAVGEVKEQADLVTVSNDKDGVTAVIESMIATADEIQTF